jgi:predicted ATPase
MKTMIETVTLKNFKAIKSAKLKLTSPTIFIGNNGSGKSSVIEALQTLQNVMLDNVSNAFTNRWYGLEKVRNQHANSDPIEIQISGKLDDKKFDYHIAFNTTTNYDLYFVASEHFTLRLGKEKEKVFSILSETEQTVTLKTHHRIEAQNLLEYIRSWQFTNIIPELMYDPVTRKQTNQIVKLDSTGKNLADVFSRLQDDLTTFNVILDRMRYVLPDLADITAKHDDLRKEVFLQLQENHHQTALPNWLFSTGTLRILALLMLLNSPNPPPVLFIEEIENGLDPRTLNLLVEEIRNSIQTTQVIVTSHSPYFLDLMDLSHIIVAEREKGNTTYFRPDNDKNLIEWKKEFSAGQLYSMGKLTKS